LSEGLAPWRPADRVKPDEMVSGLLEDIREAIHDYEVRHGDHGIVPGVDEDNSWYDKSRSTIKDSN